MRTAIAVGVLAFSAFTSAQTPAAVPPARGPLLPAAEPYDFGAHAGWTSLFDGTLTAWEFNPAVWSVQQGVITAASTPERRVGTSYIFWKGGEVGDFELKLEFKLEGDVHSGIAYRNWTDPNRGASLGPAAGTAASSRVGGPGPAGAVGGAINGRRGQPQPPPDVPVDPRWTLYGPGLDYDADLRNSGNVEERGTVRRVLAARGSIVSLEKGQPPRVIGTLGDSEALLSSLRIDDWNQIHIIARGHQLTHIINGRAMAIAIDDDETFFTPKGLIGWSIEQFGMGRVSVRNIWLKKL